MNLWFYLPTLEPSRNVTSNVTSNRIVKQGNKNPQNNMIAIKFFASTAHVTQWLNYLTRRLEIFTRRLNLTPQRAKNTVYDLSVVLNSLSIPRFRHKAGWPRTFLSILPETPGGGGGGYSQKNWVGVCGPLPKTLPYLWPRSAIFPTLFINWPKIRNPIYDLTHKRYNKFPSSNQC